MKLFVGHVSQTFIAFIKLFGVVLSNRHRDALRIRLTLPAECDAIGGQLLPAGPGAAHNHDGFFYALLQKS